LFFPNLEGGVTLTKDSYLHNISAFSGSLFRLILD